MKRKLYIRLLTLIVLVISFITWTKEDIHPRMNYVGDYHFKRTYYTWVEHIGNKRNIDTTYYDGYIAPDSINTSLLIIKCGEGEYGELSSCFSTRYIKYGDGNANASFRWATGHGSMHGNFIGNDSIVIRYSDGALGGGFVYEIYGKRTRKW